MIENHDYYLKMLSRAGIRPSLQRLEILEYVITCKSHPTADEVYSQLVKNNPTLSRTTVFSCLKLLAEKGMINCIDISSDSARYDYIDDEPHAHFMCRKCKRIFDIPMEERPSMALPSGFSCDNVNVFYKGICPDCGKMN